MSRYARRLFGLYISVSSRSSLLSSPITLHHWNNSREHSAWRSVQDHSLASITARCISGFPVFPLKRSSSSRCWRNLEIPLRRIQSRSTSRKRITKCSSMVGDSVATSRISFRNPWGVLAKIVEAPLFIFRKENLPPKKNLKFHKKTWQLRSSPLLYYLQLK